MNLSQKVDLNTFYSFLEKAWQPMWLANFVYCYLFVDVISFYISGSGIFSYSLVHILDVSFANIIIIITLFGIFSIFLLPIIEIIASNLITKIDLKFLKETSLTNDYKLSKGYVSYHQLSNSEIVKKFDKFPDYLMNIYLTESEKFDLKLKNKYKLQNLIVGIFIFSIFEIFVIDSAGANTIHCYFQLFFEDNVSFVYVIIFFLLSISYYKLCNSFPNSRFYNPILYAQIENIKTG